MSAFLECWPVKIVNTAVKKAAHRIIRHVRRAAGIVVSKPAAILWICVATSWPQNAIPDRDVATNGPQSAIAGNAAAAGDFFPPEFDNAALIPPLRNSAGPEFFALPPAPPPPTFEIIGPPVLLPELPAETPPAQPIPEPGALAMLATGIAALIAWRTRA